MPVLLPSRAARVVFAAAAVVIIAGCATAPRESAASSTVNVFRTIRTAVRELPDANLALISVPGHFAVAEARKELERATTLGDGDDPVIFDHLGDVYNHLKMRPEASRAWQRALELYNQGVRGKEDDRVRDIRRKIEQVKEEVGAR